MNAHLSQFDLARASHTLKRGLPIPAHAFGVLMELADDAVLEANAAASEYENLFEEEKRDCKEAADRAADMEEERDTLQERLDDLQTSLDDLLDGDAGEVIRAKLEILSAECVAAVERATTRMLTARKQSERRHHMRELNAAIYVAFRVATPDAKRAA